LAAPITATSINPETPTQIKLEGTNGQAMLSNITELDTTVLLRVAKVEEPEKPVLGDYDNDVKFREA
jgi:hypothetical protein